MSGGERDVSCCCTSIDRVRLCEPSGCDCPCHRGEGRSTSLRAPTKSQAKRIAAQRETTDASRTLAHDVTHLTVIKRDTDPPEVLSWRSLAEAQGFYERASEQWSESYLAAVVKGPGPARVDPRDARIQVLEAALRVAVLALRGIDGMTGTRKSRHDLLQSFGYRIAEALGLGDVGYHPLTAVGAALADTFTVERDAAHARVASAEPATACECGHSIEEHGNSRTGACDECECVCFDAAEATAAREP